VVVGPFLILSCVLAFVRVLPCLSRFRGHFQLSFTTLIFQAFFKHACSFFGLSPQRAPPTAFLDEASQFNYPAFPDVLLSLYQYRKDRRVSLLPLLSVFFLLSILRHQASPHIFFLLCLNAIAIGFLNIFGIRRILESPLRLRVFPPLLFRTPERGESALHYSPRSFSLFFLIPAEIVIAPPSMASLEIAPALPSLAPSPLRTLKVGDLRFAYSPFPPAVTRVVFTFFTFSFLSLVCRSTKLSFPFLQTSPFVRGPPFASEWSGKWRSFGGLCVSPLLKPLPFFIPCCRALFFLARIRVCRQSFHIALPNPPSPH